MLISVVLALALAACSSSDPGSVSTTIAGTATTDQAKTSEPASAGVERFAGSVEDFYRVPDPLPKGQPGELIRTMPLDDDADPAEPGTTSVRVMYHSRDANDRDRAVTGVITYPTGAPPEGGWPVVTSAHGTTGIAPQCAPSRWIGRAPAYGVRGVRVATDYIGLGPVGELHPYLSGLDEGHSVLDIVRAARNLAAAHAGTRYLIWGHSQGGHAALWAHELSESYAPELDLAGTAALAPAAELTKTYGAIDEIVANVVSLMALYGAGSEAPQIHPEDYVGPTVQRQAKVVTTDCLDEVTKVFGTIPRSSFYDAQPQETEPMRSLILANDPGQVAVDAPLLLVQGDQDIRVHPLRTADLFTRECGNRQRTEYHLFEGDDHDSVIGASSSTVEAFLQARLADGPAIDSCSAGAPTVHPPA